MFLAAIEQSCCGVGFLVKIFINDFFHTENLSERTLPGHVLNDHASTNYHDTDLEVMVELLRQSRPIVQFVEILLTSWVIKKLLEFRILKFQKCHEKAGAKYDMNENPAR